jgi:hypothetical protein
VSVSATDVRNSSISQRHTRTSSLR